MRLFNNVMPLALLAGMFLGATNLSQASLVAYYPFEGNTNDLSGNGYNGTVEGTSTYAPGKYGQAFSFNGFSDIATTTTDNLQLVNHSFTVSAWVNFANTNDQSIFGTPTFNNNQGLHLLQRNNRAYLGFFFNDTQGNATLTPNTWINLAFVYDLPTQTQSIYINGNLDASQSGHAAFAGTGQTAYIGASCCSGQAIGLFDNIKIFNTALTQAEVQQAALPEPSSLALLGVAAVGLCIAALRRAA